jgi:chromosome segregation and condensation protein ScpB
MPSLETLAIIAYKQPIIKAELEQIRGVNSDGVIKTLLDKRLIKIMGRKEVPGKLSSVWNNTEFLQYFDKRPDRTPYTERVCTGKPYTKTSSLLFTH